MATKKRKPKRKLVITTMRLPAELMKQVDAAVEDDDSYHYRSNIVEAFIREGLKRHAISKRTAARELARRDAKFDGVLG